ncbi:DUF3798 domain-containing protein [Eubacteriales bacterium OttesenSCG-928-K08]|nr:DUF3798 domain-containing protein [Eubacteriales bacterium OttesenSCG-928-K08]
MTKKILALALAALMMFTFVACGRGDSGTAGNDEPDFKIGIITGTVSQNEEEFQAGQKVVAKYGADKVLTATYPDKFNDEVETTIAQVVSLADQGAKAIVFCQAVPGTIAAIEKTREKYPDILFVTGVVAEAPREVAAVSDVCLLVDEIGMGTAVIHQAKAQGAETFIHYSFPRHLGYETIAARRELFIQTCEEVGIKYVDATAPDPTGDAGTSGAQQFIVEDVPRKVAEYGPNTAFFSTNCALQEPLIRGVLEQKAIYPQQCCPSPYHGYPSALNIDTTGHEGDVQYLLDQATEIVAAAGNTGRMSTWKLPVNMLMVEAGAEYAIMFCKGETNGRFDDTALRAAIDKVAAEYDASASLSYYSDAEGELNNFYMILCDFYNF